MSKHEHVFVVGCGFPQLGLIRAARRLGISTTGCDLNPSAIGVGLVDHFVQASTGDVGQVVSAYKKSGAEGISTSGSELALTTTVHAAELLGLPFYADRETVHRCQAKDAMRAGYVRAGLEVPQFEGCTTLEQAEAFAAKVGYPVVIKPANGWGQRGVSKVLRPEDLPSCLELGAKMSHGGGGVVVEACIEGHEVSVNGWVEDGDLRAYCVTDREVFEGTRPLGVMRSEVTPSRLPDGYTVRAVACARAGAKALGLTRGPCYSQVAVGETRAVLFETAARLGGGFDADVTYLWSGVDLYARLLGVALENEELERGGVVSRRTPALVRFLRPEPGILTAIKGLEEARGLEGVVDAVVYPRVGDTVLPMTDAAKRIGHILVEGATREQAVQRAELAEKMIRLVVSSTDKDVQC